MIQKYFNKIAIFFIYLILLAGIIQIVAGFDISGFVTDSFTGLPLSNVNVTTNTSNSTTTNASGFYNFTGLSNGTYIVNASLSGYDTNSTTAAINGSDVANANISLSPLPAPTFLISGQVTNASSGIPLDNATVTTNTSLSTTTNASGFYNFTGLSNGTYLVNASLAGFTTNSTNVTVSGSNVTDVNISLSPLPVLTFMVSGFVTNASSGLPLGNATVMTNTSLSTITNVSGFYNFTGLPNGTYIVNASLAGYNTNSTNVNINGSNVTNANISLSPLPAQTYLISGYVTDASSGLTLSNASVTTNTSLSTTTNASGFYNFIGLSNRTYIVNASLAGYDTNSTTAVINGANVTNANISLSPVPAPPLLPPGGFESSGLTGPVTLKVVTNRQAILDDPSGWDGGSTTPSIANLGNQWSGENTMIRWYVLLMNSSGRPAQNINITSKLLFPNGSIAVTKTSPTNSFGIAEFFQDMDRWLRFNGSGSEGVYTINATIITVDNTSVVGNSNFIYDEWGCGSGGSGCHRSQYWQGSGVDSKDANTWASGSIQNSPYLHAWDNFHSNSGHGGKGSIGTGECLTCHRGFDGVDRQHNSRVTATPQYSGGLHNGKANAGCTDCHTTFNSGTMPIKQCYDCHPKKNNNLTVKTFNQTAASGFSYQPLTDPKIMAHNGGQNIACILCHDNGHKITKPYDGIPNNYTEYQQCTNCHNTYNRHNDTVSCTVCHSQDAHVIKVFARDAAYINGSTSSSRGNCTNCHQNSSFLGTLLTQPKAGSHSGSAPQIPVQFEHSNDINAGNKWGSYWTPGNQLSACKYCHGLTTHNTSALGRITIFKGNNTMNSSLANGTWCRSCHYSGYSNYADMVNTFSGENLPIPPAIIPGTYYPTSGAFNHSTYKISADQDCYTCHGGGASYASVSPFMHDVTIGVMNCNLCHYDYSYMNSSGRPKLYVNQTFVNESVHAALNCQNCHTDTSAHPPPKSGWKWCEDCHAKQQNPNTNKSRHNIVNNPWNNLFNGISAVNITSCITCHNSTLYNNSKNTYGKQKGIDCDYCHAFPDNNIG